MDIDFLVRDKNYEEYKDYIKVNVPSSFVTREMKSPGEGSGEAKLYLGKQNDRLNQFFQWEETRDEEKQFKFCLSKSNLLEYMQNVKIEYIYHKFNEYVNANRDYWNEMYQKISSMNEQEFNFYLKLKPHGRRYYIQIDQEDKPAKKIFNNTFRKILVPKLTNIYLIKDREAGEGTFNILVDVNYDFSSTDSHGEESVEDIELPSAENIELPYNRILFGAPGTGKSYLLNEDRKSYFPTENSYERVTFHPAYSYAQFFGSYKPVSDGHEIFYQFVLGPFLRMLLKSLSDPEHNYLLIIEEINRADVAAVFGDTFQLLDRTNGKSDYKIDISEDLQRYIEDDALHVKFEINWDTLKDSLSAGKLYLPSNFYLWATMNSADQGVMPLDTAFKRRWTFQYIGINDGEENADFETPASSDTGNGLSKYRWQNIRHLINDCLENIPDIAEDRWLGPFFLKAEDFASENIFEERFQSKVLMYLYQDIAKYSNPGDLFSKSYTSYSQLCEDFKKDGMNIFAINQKDEA